MADVLPGLDEELDLDYDDEAPDPNADAPLIDAPRYTRTEVAPYHEDLPVMWDAVRAFRASKNRKVDAGGQSRVVRTDKEYIGDPPPAAARLYARLQAAGWRVRMIATTVRVEELRYVGTTAEHDAGDVRTPMFQRRHWFLQGVLMRGDTRIAWFKADWSKVDGGGNKFGSAATWDIATGHGFEPGATGFDDWVSIFAPKPEPKRKKAPAPEPATTEGFWVAREM